jgi:hypothetical protein
MVSPKSFFSRMNENRGDNWLDEEKLKKGTEDFFRSNDYVNIEYDKTLDQGVRTFLSPLTATKTRNAGGRDTSDIIVTIIKPKIKQYDLSFFGLVETLTLDITDNYEHTNLMLVTDSLSYTSIIKNEQISVEIENMMRVYNIFVLFLNHRFAFALFDKFENMTKPIPLSD